MNQAAAEWAKVCNDSALHTGENKQKMCCDCADAYARQQVEVWQAEVRADKLPCGHPGFYMCGEGACGFCDEIKQQVEVANRGKSPCRWCGWTIGPHDALRCRTDERDRLEEYFREAVDALSPYLQSGGKYAHLMQLGQSITTEGPKRLVEYLEQQVEAFREQACRALCTFCDQLGRHNVGSPNEFEVKPEANGRHDIVYVSVYSSLFPNLCKATAIRGLSLSSLAATPHEDVLVAPPATPPAPASPDGRP